MKVININLVDKTKELLAVNDNFKNVLFKFEPGKGLANHSHNGFAAVQIISGAVIVEFETGEKFEMKEGDYISFDARIQHNLIALIESKVLVTIGLK